MREREREREDEALNFNFLTIRRAYFIEVLTAVLKFCAEDVTKAQRRHSLAVIILTAAGIACISARTCGEG